MRFEQSTYSVNENVGVLKVYLVLGNPISTPITIQVSAMDISTTGMYNIIIKY